MGRPVVGPRQSGPRGGCQMADGLLPLPCVGGRPQPSVPGISTLFQDPDDRSSLPPRAGLGRLRVGGADLRAAVAPHRALRPSLFGTGLGPGDVEPGGMDRHGAAGDGSLRAHLLHGRRRARAGSAHSAGRVAVPLPEPEFHLPASHPDGGQEDACGCRGQRVRIQRGQRVRQRALHLAPRRLRAGMARRPALPRRAGDLRDGFRPQHSLRQHPPAAEEARRPALFNSATGRVPVRFVSQLPGRAAGVGRMGARYVVPGRARVLRLYRRQPRAEGAQPRPLVQGTVRRLSAQPEGGDPGML